MATVEITSASRWYGNVVAVNDVTMTIGPGITGLLGPNGAGKSTLINMVAGLLPASTGAVTLSGAQVNAEGEQMSGEPPTSSSAVRRGSTNLGVGEQMSGEPPTSSSAVRSGSTNLGVGEQMSTWKNPEIFRLIGIVPEREAAYDFLTGWQFVLANAELHELPDPGAAAMRALETVAMTDARERKIGTYSKGMKQRVKMASALVHDPDVLLLDEPFNGMDPRQRLHLIELLRKMGNVDGRTILFSSHILEEVEQLAHQIEVLVAGRHAASGDYREIRRLMTDRPHQYVIKSSDDRALATALMGDRCASAVALDADSGLRVETTEFLRFASLVPKLARDGGIRLFEVTPTDESLESVFSYLVRA